jgi:hypothetical protein
MKTLRLNIGPFAIKHKDQSTNYAKCGCGEEIESRTNLPDKTSYKRSK